jgi:hypothetical protein
MATYDDRDRIEPRETRDAVYGNRALTTALVLVAIFAGLFALYRWMPVAPVDNRPAVTEPNRTTIPTTPRDVTPAPVPKPAPQ